MDRAMLKKMFDGLVAGKLPLNATEEEIFGFLSPGFTGDLRTKMPPAEATGLLDLPSFDELASAALAAQGRNAASDNQGDATGDVVVAASATTSVAVAQGRGRPLVIDAEKRKKILLVLEAGFTRAISASEAGVSLRTLKRAIARDAKFREEVERAEAMCEEWPLITIIKAARKNWHAAAWLLKHKPYEAGRGREPGKGTREPGGEIRKTKALSNFANRRRLEHRVDTSPKLLEASEVTTNDNAR